MLIFNEKLGYVLRRWPVGYLEGAHENVKAFIFIGKPNELF